MTRAELVLVNVLYKGTIQWAQLLRSGSTLMNDAHYCGSVFVKHTRNNMIRTSSSPLRHLPIRKLVKCNKLGGFIQSLNLTSFMQPSHKNTGFLCMELEKSYLYGVYFCKRSLEISIVSLSFTYLYIQYPATKLVRQNMYILCVCP